MKYFYKKGSATLMMTLVMLAAMTVFSLMSTQYARSAQNIYANYVQAEQAVEAAQAGLDYGNNYLQPNRATIIVDANNDGYIDTNASSATLGDGSSYTFVYSNPTQNNFQIIKVVSTGKSSDGTATRTASGVMNITPWLAYLPPVSVAMGQAATLGGSSNVTNTGGSKTIWSGGSVGLSGSATTSLGSGVASSASTNGGDIIASDPNLGALTQATFFTNFFGETPAQVKSQANIVATNPSGLNGVTGQLIWLENGGSTISFSGNAVIGSPTAPVVMVINGDATFSGTVQIYGTIYVAGASTQLKGSFNVEGSILSYGTISLLGTSSIDSSTTTFTSIQQQGNYSSAGSGWNDMGY